MSIFIKKCERECCVPDCKTEISENTVFHKFPSDATRKADWMHACNITTKITCDMLICGSHFTEDDYQIDKNSGLRHLKPLALPNLSLSQDSDKSSISNANKLGLTQIRRKCSIPKCTSPLPYERRSYHLVPKQEHIKQQWVRACGIRISTHPYARVCSVHFERSDFYKENSSKKLILKSDAVPTLHLPKRSSVKSDTKKLNETPDSNVDEKVTTIIYVPENCGKNIIGADGTSLDSSKIVINKNVHSNFNPKRDKNIVFSQVQNNKNNGNTTNIRKEKICSTPKVTVVKETITSPKLVKPKIQGPSPNVRNVEGKVIIGQRNNINKVVHQDNSNKHVLCKPSNVQIKRDVVTSSNKKPVVRAGISAVTLCADCGQYCKIEDQDLLYKSCKNSETLAAELLLKLQEGTLSNEDERTLLTKKGIEICNKTLQTESINLMELLTNDDELMAFTGVTYELLDKLTKWISEIEGSSSAKQNTPLRTRIALCLCKLKINASFACLGMLFGITQQSCASNFFAMIKRLSIVMEKTIHWPKTEELLKNLPVCFQSFKQTRVILNCSETEIEKQRCLNCQQKMAENNVKHQAVKLVLGVAPSGLIIFKSNVFESQSSADVSVFTQTNIMDKLDPLREAMMADETLNIEAECAQHNVTLIKLPKLGKNKQFSKHDVELIKNISSARIHVDRTLQRFKMYKIMQTKVHWRVLPYLDDVCTVIAGIVNLKNPIPPNHQIDIKSVGLIRK